jgi:hypothetical protein
LLEERTIVALHNLEAAAEVAGHPAAMVVQAIWSEAASIAKAAVNRDRVAATEVLDDQVEHVSLERSTWKASMPRGVRRGLTDRA